MILLCKCNKDSLTTLLFFRKIRNVFNYLLAVLCLTDLLVIFSSFAHALKTLGTGNFVLDDLVIFNDAVSHITVTISIFLTMSITLERYLAVCTAFTYQARVAEKGPFRIMCSYIIPAVLGAVLLNIPKIISIGNFFNLNEMSSDMKAIYIKGSIIYQMLHPLTTTCIIPIIVLAILNIKILLRSKKIHSSRRIKREQILARVMMGVVGVFILLSIPKMGLALFEVSTIPNILECYQRKCRYYISSGRWVSDISIRYMVLLNSSVNFYIYCFAGANFRKVLVGMLSKRLNNRVSSAEQTSTQIPMLSFKP